VQKADLRIAANPPVAGNQVTNPIVSAGAAAAGKQDHVPRQNKKAEMGSENHASAPVAQKAAALSSNVDLLRDLATEQHKATIKAPTTVPTGEPKVAKKEEKPKKSIASTFFSLMSGDSDEESDEEPPAARVHEEAVNKSNATIFLRYSSDEILKLKANAEKDVLPSDSIVKRNSSKGKASLAVALSQAASHLVRAKQDLQSIVDSSASQNPGVGLQAASVSMATNSQAAEPQVTVTQQPINTVEILEDSPESNQRPVVKLPQTAGTQKNAIKPKIAEASTKVKLEPTEIEHVDPNPPKTQDEAAECTVLQQEHRGKTEISSESIVNTSLRPEAPGFEPTATPELASLLLNGLNKPVEAHSLAGNIIRSTFLSGQMIIVTPIQIADGQLISGPPSGQLVMQPTTPATNQMLSLNTPTPDPFASNSPFLSAKEKSNGLAAHPSKARKPTKGLGSSMWAK
jgi:hypothetical protein